MTLTEKDVRLFNAILKKNFPDEKLVFTPNEILFVVDQFRMPEKYFETARTIGPKYKIIRHFIDYMLYKMMTNKDTLILLSGAKGQGKSSLAIMLAMLWCKKLDIKFNPKKMIVYTNEQLMGAIDTLPPFSPIIADESINFCLSENWAKAENRTLKVKLSKVRTKHFFFILCFPLKINKVEQTYLESFVNYWIDIYTRGAAAIFVRDDNQGLDAWRIGEFSKLGSYNEFTPKEAIRRKLERHPNFWKIMNVPPLPIAIYNRYLKIREKNVYNTNTSIATITKDAVMQALLVQVLRDIMMRDGSVTMKRLLIHIRNEHDIDVAESELSKAIADTEDLLKKAIELGIVGRISKTENSNLVKRLAKDNIKEALTKVV